MDTAAQDNRTPDLTRRLVLRGATVTAGAVVATPLLAESAEARRRRHHRRRHHKHQHRKPTTTSAACEMLPITAANADRLVDIIGVNTKFNWGTSAYAQVDRSVSAINDLGIRHVRGRIASLTNTRNAFKSLAQSGVQIQGVCGALGDPQTMSAVMEEVLRTYSNPTKVFSAFEGINEPNNDGVPWIAETRQKTNDIRRYRDAYGLKQVPLLGPSMCRINSNGIEGWDTQEQSRNLGDLSSVLDFGNIHVYPRGRTPSTDIDMFVGYQRPVCDDLPMICSEGGYFTADGYTGGAFNTPETVVAVYQPRHIMEHWWRGTTRYYIYELLDRPDPTGTDRLSSFGLLSVGSTGTTWSPKPHYHALKNLISIMSDPGAPHSVPGMNLSVSGVPDLRTSLFAKRDGSRYLAMWRDVDCWDPVKNVPIDVSSLKATVTFEDRRSVTLYRPTASASPVGSFGAATSVTVPVGDELVIARIV